MRSVAIRGAMFRLIPLAIAAMSVAAAPTGKISVKVLDPAGTALEGIEVTVYPGPFNGTQVNGSGAGAPTPSGPATGGGKSAGDTHSQPRSANGGTEDGGKKITTDKTGKAELTDLAPGRYKLVVQAPGYKPTYKAVKLEAGKTANVEFKLVKAD